MPFRSKAQQRAAFSGALGPTMQRKAPAWAAKTPTRVPERVPGSGHTRYHLSQIRKDTLPKKGTA